MEIKIRCPVLAHILTQSPERMTYGHIPTRRVGHLVHPDQGLPVFPGPIIDRPPVPPESGLINIDDPSTSGVIRVFRDSFDDPTPTLRQFEVGRRPRHACPALCLIAELHLLLLRPSNTGHLTRRKLPSCFDQLSIEGQLLG